MSAARVRWVVLACLAVAGCATGMPGSRLAVAPGVTLQMAPISIFFEPKSVSQLLWIERDGETRFLHVHVELGPDQIGLAAFDGLGVRLFSVAHDGSTLTVDRALSPPGLPVEIMLADFLLAFAPESTLQPRLRGARIVSTGDGARREVVKGVRRLATIEYRESEIIYTRADLGYRVTIRSLEAGEP